MTSDRDDDQATPFRATTTSVSYDGLSTIPVTVVLGNELLRKYMALGMGTR
jgi:hypothetical protein